MPHGVELFPALDRLLRRASVAPRDVGLVAVGMGPGSYTGLRVGVTAARAFAYAAGAELLGVPSCDAWAAAAPLDARPLAVVLDARIRAVYLATYEAAGGMWTRRTGPELLAPAAAAARIAGGADGAREGLSPYHEACGAGAAEATPRRADAAQVAGIALARRARGERDAIDAVVPLYLRKTEAELKLEGRADA